MKAPMDRAVSFQRSVSKKLGRKRSNKASNATNPSSTTSDSPEKPLSLLRSRPLSQPSFDDVRDGKFFHIRVTVGYLTSLRTAYTTPEASRTSEMVCAYVSFGSCGEYDFATSLPLLPHKPRQTVKWPKSGDGVKTSKRRLYHSILLRTSPGSQCEELLENTSIPLHVGVQRGDEIASLGIASLNINGKVFKSKKVDLPVTMTTAILPDRGATGTGDHSFTVKDIEDPSKPTKRGQSKLKNIFTKKSQNSKPPLPRSSKVEIFPNHDKIYAVDNAHSYLRIKLDVQDGVYDLNGPGLWGDLEDDEESFGPISVINIPDDGRGELTNRYAHESIEVISLQQQGTTIISSPGIGEAKEEAENIEDAKLYKYNHQQEDSKKQRIRQQRRHDHHSSASSLDDAVVLARRQDSTALLGPSALAICGATMPMIRSGDDDDDDDDDYGYDDYDDDDDDDDDDTIDSVDRDPILPSYVDPYRTHEMSVQESQLSYSVASTRTGNDEDEYEEDEESGESEGETLGATFDETIDDEEEEDIDEETVTTGTRSVEVRKSGHATASLIKYASRLGVQVEDLLGPGAAGEDESETSSSYASTNKSSVSTRNEWKRM